MTTIPSFDESATKSAFRWKLPQVCQVCGKFPNCHSNCLSHYLLVFIIPYFSLIVNRSSLFIAPQNLRFESGGLICFLIYKFILDKLVFPSYNALTAEEKSHWDLGLFSLFSTAFRIYFLTTSLTIVRFGLRGFSITREHLFPWFCLHAITKRYYLTLKKLKPLGWGGRDRKFKSCHSEQKSIENTTFF